MVNMRQALGVDDFNQMSNYTGQLQNQRRSVGQKQYGLGGKVLDMAAALGDAYNQYQPPETALGMMALPAKAVYGLGNMIVQDVGDKTKSIMGTDRSNPAAMDQAATDAFGLAADTMAGGGVVSRMTDMPQGVILGANVFQGGPHKYGPEGAADSLNHMSKGEGAQAYGWGRYDAEAQRVGQEYRDQLTDYRVGLDDKVLTGKENVADFARDFGVPEADAKTILKIQRAVFEDPRKEGVRGFIESRKSLLDMYKDGASDPHVKISIDEFNEQLRVMEKYKDRLKDADGYLYKHDLPDEDIARYLDYDAPLSEQPEALAFAQKMMDKDRDIILAKRRADEAVAQGRTEPLSPELNAILQEWSDKFPNDVSPSELAATKVKLRTDEINRLQPLLNLKWGPEKKGSGLYKELQGLLGSDKAASEALAKAGIPGLKYFDGMSRPASSTKSLIEAAGSQEAALANARKRFDSADADWGPMADDHKRRWADAIRELEKPQTRNFVTWDQDVLNRMKLLERNGEDMTKALMPK